MPIITTTIIYVKHKAYLFQSMLKEETLLAEPSLSSLCCESIIEAAFLYMQRLVKYSMLNYLTSVVKVNM